MKKNSLLFFTFILPFFGKLLGDHLSFSPSGVTILLIFLSVLIQWLFIAPHWPVFFALLYLGLLTPLPFKELFAASFGSSTWIFLFSTFLCTAALSSTGFFRRSTIFFLRNPIAQRGEWALVFSFLLAVFLPGLFISPTVLFILFFPFVEEIAQVLCLKKGDPLPEALMMGLVFTSAISSGVTPISHVFPLMAMDYYKEATGKSISFFGYSLYALPIGLLLLGAMALLFYFRYGNRWTKTDLTKIRELHEPKGDLREKRIVAVFFLIVALWIFPDLFRPLLPENSFLLKGFVFPPLLGVVLLSAITVEGKPLLDLPTAVKDHVPLTPLFMAAGALTLGFALGHDPLGPGQGLQALITPFTQGLSPQALLFFFTLWAAIQTNLSSNIVTVSLVSAVALPAALTSGNSTPLLVAANIGMMASFAFAFPPAMPSVALAGSSGWVSSKILAVYGSLLAAFAVMFAVLLGPVLLPFLQ